MDKLGPLIDAQEELVHAATSFGGDLDALFDAAVAYAAAREAWIKWADEYRDNVVHSIKVQPGGPPLVELVQAALDDLKRRV